MGLEQDEKFKKFGGAVREKVIFLLGSSSLLKPTSGFWRLDSPTPNPSSHHWQWPGSPFIRPFKRTFPNKLSFFSAIIQRTNIMELVVQQHSEVILGGQYTVPSQPTLQGQKIDFYKQTQFVHPKNPPIHLSLVSNQCSKHRPRQ